MIKRRATKSGPRDEVRLRAADGRERSRSFRTRKSAERYEHHRSLRFECYAEQWLSQRHDLRPRTAEVYESLLRCHILPTFGALPLAEITASAVRSWNAELVPRYAVTAAKVYRLLRCILATA